MWPMKRGWWKGEIADPHFPSTWGSPNINYPITCCEPIKAFPRLITQSCMITERADVRWPSPVTAQSLLFLFKDSRWEIREIS